MSDSQTKTPRRPLPDLLAAVGLALVSYGAWRAWPPAGFIVAGVGLIAVAVIAALNERRSA